MLGVCAFPCHAVHRPTRFRRGRRGFLVSNGAERWTIVFSLDDGQEGKKRPYTKRAHSCEPPWRNLRQPRKHEGDSEEDS